ncbi:MAG: carboxylesterase/lipase family protein [Microthrixaceae bacterium]
MNSASDGTSVSVSTLQGTLRGVWHDKVARFAGIPFAEPPVGDLRFRPPVAPAPWHGELDATSFGCISPQNPSLMDSLFGGETEEWSEDCLYLNIWTQGLPLDTTSAALAGLPVMVWVHGGGFEMGSGSSPLYHGTSFATEGVVLVTINYRLGSLGFLELGSLDPAYAGSGNLGLLDQIAALEWVKGNIEQFGGDANNVTIFGESAGAMSVSTLLTMPRAQGLFHKVIAQSGAASSSRTSEQAFADTAEYLAAGQFTTIEDLKSATVQELLAAHASLGATRTADPELSVKKHNTPLAFLPFRPVADGKEVPTDPLGAVVQGAAQGIPLLIGTNLEEWKLFALMTPPATTEEGLLARFGLVVSDPNEAVQVYRKQFPEASSADLESAVLTDFVFRIPATRLAEAQAVHAPVWQYRFDWRTPVWNGLLGAAHAVEIPFVFDLVHDHRLHVLVGAEAPNSLSSAMHFGWIEFARTGVPSAADLPEWPLAESEGRPVMLLEAVSTIAFDPEPITTNFWKSEARPLG